MKKAFNNWKHNAIHLTFPNGNALSTIWGYGSYSDNYNRDDIPNLDKRFNTFFSSNTVEIMILQAPKKLVEKIHKKFNAEDSSVIGRLSMTDWLWIVKQLSK